VLTNPPFGKKSSLMVVNVFWLKDDSLEDSANLEVPDVIAAEIVEDLRAALEEFELILGDLSSYLLDQDDVMPPGKQCHGFLRPGLAVCRTGCATIPGVR